MKTKAKGRLPSKVGDVVRGLDLGRCPFCPQGELALSPEPFAVMHTMPVCLTFAAESPIDFLRVCIKRASDSNKPS